MIEKPDINEIKRVLNDAVGSRTQADWKKTFVDSLTKILKGKPLSYRSFGPYWWGVKTALVNAGVTEFGESIDTEWFNKMSYGDDALNLIAGFCYSDPLIDRGKAIESAHVLYDDEDPVEYTIADEEMEMLDGVKMWAL